MAAPKRRWDQAPDDPAKAVREKVQAQLAEKGLKFASKDGPSREIEINDSPHRFLLTKGTLHDEVRRLTGATVTTKGMFVANRAASKERGLYLLVQGTTQETVDAAAEWLGKVMSGQIVPEAAAQLREYQTGGGAQPPPPPGAPPPSGPVPQPPPASLGFDAKVFVGVEHSEAQAVGFSLIGKLFGQGGSFLKHISSSTGNTRVLLRGRYPLSSSPDGTNKNFADEPLHLALSAPSQAQVDAAKGLAENLIEHVRKEWNEHRERKSRAHGPGTGYRGPSHDGHAPHMHHPQQPQHMHAPQHQQQFQQPQHMHAPQHQAYQQQPGVAGGAVPAMDPYYAQYYMQQLYAYDPAAYYAYAAQYQPYAAADQAAAAAPSAAPAAPDATPLGPARPTAAELAHSVAALPEAPPPPPPAAAEGDGHAKRRAEEAAAEEGEDEDEAAEAAHGAPAKRSAVDSAAKTGAPAAAAASAAPARPFWAPPNDAAPSPLLHKK